MDIGFGDTVHPEAVWAEFPTVLASPAPRVRVYSRASVVAEKLHAMVKLGMINSRMKDYHDIWFLSTRSTFKFAELAGAIAATFEARKTSLPVELEGLSDEFVRLHTAMWEGFQRREPTLSKIELVDVVNRLRAFIEPCLADRLLSNSSLKIWVPVRCAWVVARDG